MILRLPERKCDMLDDQLISLISEEIETVNLFQPPNDAEVIAENVTCGPEAGGYKGRTAWKQMKSYDLGSSKGTVNIIFEPYFMPDRFIIYYNNKICIDTGFRGKFNGSDNLGNPLSATWNTIGSPDRDAFIKGLSGKEDPIVKLKYPNKSIPGTLSDGYPKVIDSKGHFTMSFNKKHSNINEAFVYIYAPGADTAWDMIMGCPGENIQAPAGGFIAPSPQ